MRQRAYCEIDYHGGTTDEERDHWCEMYHRLTHPLPSVAEMTRIVESVPRCVLCGRSINAPCGDPGCERPPMMMDRYFPHNLALDEPYLASASGLDEAMPQNAAEPEESDDLDA